MRKLILPLVLVSIVIAGVTFFFFAGQTQGYSENSAFRAIPVKTPLFIEVPELESLLDESDNQNPLVNELKQIKDLDSFFKDIRDLKEQLKGHELLRKVIADKTVLVAFNPEGKDNIGCLFATSLDNRKERSALIDYFSSLATNNEIKLGSRKYDNTDIYQLKSGNSQFSIAFKEGILLFSRYPLFIDEAIRQISAENLTGNQQLTELHKTAGSGSEFNIYVQHNHFPSFISKAVPRDFRKQIKLLGNLSDWTELDVNIKKSELLLNGFSFSNDSNNNYFNIFRRQKAERVTVPEVLSANTSLFLNLSIEKLERFNTDYEEYLKKLGMYYSRETELSKIQRYSKVPFTKVFQEIAKNEFAVAFGTITQNNPTKNRFFIAKMKGQSVAREKLLPVLENYAKAQKTTLEAMRSDYQIQNDRSFSIYQFPFKKLPELLFGQAFSGIESNFMCFYDNYLIFADNATALKNYIHDLVLSETLENDTQFQDFNSQLTSRSSIYFYLNFSKAFYLSNYYLDEDISKSIGEHELSIRKFQALGWQISPSNEQFLNSVYLKFDPVLKEEPQTVWQSKLDSTVAIKPQLVINHNDKANKEVIIQDNKNNLYLINKEGVNLWKVKLPGQIMGKIYQIDYYKNGKLQYLFNTKNHLHLIDREGNNVARYPINLRAPATNGLAVFDYDNNRKYRFFIACENKEVYAYDNEGNLVRGWDFKGTDGKVTSPVKHFRVAGKDYIVCADQYKTYILDRRGNTRVSTKAGFEHSDNEFYLVTGKQQAIASTDVNGVVHLQYFNGHEETVKTTSLSKNHFFEAEDINADGKSDFVLADEKQLIAFTDRGKQIFEREFDSPITSKPNSYMFSNNDRKIGVVCGAENRVYLINSDGSVYDGFPLHGNTDFTIGFFNHSNPFFNLVVGNEDNSFYNYQVE